MNNVTIIGVIALVVMIISFLGIIWNPKFYTTSKFNFRFLFAIIMTISSSVVALCSIINLVYGCIEWSTL